TSRTVGTIWGYDNHQGTVEVNQPPTPTFASVSLYEIIGDGRGAVGIRSFEFRDTPDGPNQTIDFGDFFAFWPSAQWHPLMTRVTFGISNAGSTSHGGFALDFWSESSL